MQSIKKHFAVVGALVVFFVGVPWVSHAAIIASHTFSGASAASSWNNNGLFLGTGLTGTFSKLTIKVDGLFTITSYATARIYCNNVAYDPSTGSGYSPCTMNNPYGEYDFRSASQAWPVQSAMTVEFPASGAQSGPLVFDPTKYYYVVNAPIIGGGYWSLPYSTDGNRSGASFTLENDIPPSSGVTMTSPTATTYTNNPITFAGTYTNVNTFNQIRFILTNTTVGASVNMAPVDLPLQTVVDSAWSVSRSLPFQGNYTVRAYLFSTFTGSSTPLTSTITFGLGATSTVSTTTQSNLPGTPLPIDCGTFDIGCYIKNAFVWLFYPTEQATAQFSQLTLEASFPFSYAYEFDDVLDELFNSSTTASTTISVSVPWFGGTTTTLTFLSAAMLSAVPYSSTVRTIILYLLWLGLAIYIYRSVLKSHDQNTSV